MCMLDVSTQRKMPENSQFTCYSNFNIHDVVDTKKEKTRKGSTERGFVLFKSENLK